MAMAIVKYNRPEKNVSNLERWLMTIGGAALTLVGFRKKSIRGAFMAAGGASLIYSGLSGRCAVYEALGINTAKKTDNPIVSVPHGEGIKIEKRIIVNRPPEELYRFWRNFENLPTFMKHLESVTVLDRNRSHWVAKAPAGMTVEWDAEIHNEIENELIAWRSVEGSDVNHAGSVEFRRAPDGRGTEVKVVINYQPPAGKLGAVIAKMFGEEPSQQVEEELERFKQLMKSGDTEDQTSKEFEFSHLE
jgi:uncharacterized membrane protein